MASRAAARSHAPTPTLHVANSLWDKQNAAPSCAICTSLMDDDVGKSYRTP